MQLCTSTWEMDLLQVLLRFRSEDSCSERWGRASYWHLTLEAKTPRWSSYFWELMLFIKHNIINIRDQTPQAVLALDRFLSTSKMLWCQYLLLSSWQCVRCHVNKDSVIYISWCFLGMRFSVSLCNDFQLIVGSVLLAILDKICVKFKPSP